LKGPPKWGFWGILGAGAKIFGGNTPRNSMTADLRRLVQKLWSCSKYYTRQRNDKKKHNKCVSKTDTNPPFAFQIAVPRGTDFTEFLQGGSKSRDLQSEISVRIGG